jgi:hypothetical protein
MIESTRPIPSVNSTRFWPTGNAVDGAYQSPLGETERASHYYDASLLSQFNTIIHLDHTGRSSRWTARRGGMQESPDTYPTGL